VSKLQGEAADRLAQLAKEQAARRIESLRLYEPQPTQELFHRSRATERVVRGGNRSGKSLCTFVEDARAATGQDPYGKYPDGPLTIWLICFEEGNIGRTAYRLLCKAGAFRMIRDQQTGQWRAFRPWLTEDASRERETKPAPPLIPPRMIDSISWKDKGRRIFSVIHLKNGSEIHAFSSGGEPPQGDPADLIHIDEDLKYESFIPEMEARLSDRKGRLIWSVFPHSKNDALVQLCRRAEEQKGRDDPDVEEFRLTFSGNPFIDRNEKRKRFEGWSDEERLARDYGEFMLDAVRVYPTFSIETHGAPQNCDPFGRSYESQPWEFDQMLIERQVPRDWTRYMIVDPGHSICAVLFAAVPPPRVGDFVLAYDELYLRNCDVQKFGKAVSDKASGYSFYAFLIDDHGSRIRTAVSSKTIRQQYSEELRNRNVESESTGHGFIPGSDDVQGRINAVRTWLSIRDDGTTRFRILRGACPNMETEFNDYRKKISGREILDDPIAKRNHLMNCLEYLAAYNPRFHPVLKTNRDSSSAYLDFQELMADISRSKGPRAFNLGPGKC
jgi:hypothetical protein